MQQRKQCKNVIHGILLQDAITIRGTTFSNAYTRALHGFNDYRMEGNLRIVDLINVDLARTSAQIHAAADVSQDAQLLKTIPGVVGGYTAPALSSAIDDAKRLSGFGMQWRHSLGLASVRQILDRRDTSREDNQKGRQACAPQADRVSPYACQACMTQQTLTVPPARKGKERHFQGCSPCGIKDAAHHVARYSKTGASSIREHPFFCSDQSDPQTASKL